MSDADEKLIVKLGQRISEQNEILRMIAASLEGVESHLRQIAVSSNPAPNYQRPLSEYPMFDWSSIGATVPNRDGDGATSVEWNGQVFTRRSPSNKFDAAIWFSRHMGQDSDGCDLKNRMAVTATGWNSRNFDERLWGRYIRGMVLQTLLADPAVIRLVKIVSSSESMTLVAQSVQKGSLCPSCDVKSTRIHSRYARKLADLPWMGIAVKIELLARRFFCDNASCSQNIFCERLPSVVSKHARRTIRLNDALAIIGFTLSAEAGGRLTLELGMGVSADTLLRMVRQTAFQPLPAPRVLGVDDFAFRRRRSYRTILVDLERRCPIDLLPDRESETLARWLRAHPGIEVVCRDRSRAYAEAISVGAPGAAQVADRWHLIKNLSEAMERLLTRKHKLARDAAQLLVGAPKKESSSPGAESAPRPVTLLPVQPRAQVIGRRAKRIELYDEVMRLKREGVTTEKIVRRVGKSPRTIYRWIQAGEFREHVKHRRSALDSHLPYITSRWAEGCRNISELWRELAARGYRGSRKSLSNYLHRRILMSEPTSRHRSKHAKPKHAKRANKSSSLAPMPSPSPRQAVWMLFKPEGLKQSQKEMIDELRRLSPEIKNAADLACRFLQLVRGRQAEQLSAWVIDVEQSGVLELKAFARGLEQDRAAVNAALSQEWSNGQVEGQVHRLKLLKRQMYGRAKSDLLRAKVLLAA